MIRSAVTISLVDEARSGPFVYHGGLAGSCRKAGELGFDAVEIFPPSADAIDPAELRGLLDRHGLALAAVGTGAGWVRHKLHMALPSAEDRKRARSFIASIIDFAGHFGVPAIVGSMQGRSGDGVDKATARAYLIEALDDLGERAKSHGVPLLYEPLNRYETDQVNTIEAGLALLRDLATSNVKLLADLFHMNIEEIDLAAALIAGGGEIGHVHFVDSNRLAAGLGHLDLGPIAEALRTIRFDGFASVEAFPKPDSDRAASQAIRSHRRWFGPPER